MAKGAKKKKRLTVVACIPYLRNGPGFALPLLVDPEFPNELFVHEIDEYTNLISHFRLMRDRYSAVQISEPLSVELGDLPIYAFVDEKGVSNAGSLEKLGPTLRSFLVRKPEYTAICLQVVELLGAKEEQRDARIKMRQAILRRSGQQAAYSFYERSTLRFALWKQLLKDAPSEDSARRILSARSRLDVRVGQSGEMMIDLGGLEPRDQEAFDIEKLASELQSEFDTSSSNDTPTFEALAEDSELEGDEQNYATRVKEALRELAIANRQEQRLAIIFDALLANQDFGKALLDSYDEHRAIFTIQVLDRLRSTLSSTLPTLDRKGQVRYELYRTLVDFYGMRKGELLLEFAARLGKYPEANALISDRLNHLHSKFVEPYRSAIKKALRRSGTASAASAEMLPLFRQK